MLSTAARTLLTKNNAPRAFQLRLVSSVSGPSGNKKDDKEATVPARRKMHNTSRRESEAIESTAPIVDKTELAQAKTSTLADRFVSTAEVTVSKIFPAGFGWQTSSVIADQHFGFAADSMNFALTTGVGDMVGVMAGHCLYYAGKKSVLGEDSGINMVQEMQTGFFLGAAAFCSGTAWQPLVNALQGANLPFSQVFLGTWIGCGAAFYVGLRVGRTILSGPMKYIEEPTYENSKADVALSTAIGGATGFFVGTDAAYLPEQNFLINVVGIQDGVPDLTACAIAGTSTSLGFLTAQSGMNLVFPAGKCWND